MGISIGSSDASYVSQRDCFMTKMRIFLGPMRKYFTSSAWLLDKYLYIHKDHSGLVIQKLSKLIAFVLKVVLFGL